MNALILISTVAPVSIMIMLIVMGELSRRLGEVVKYRRMHGWFYFSALLVAVSVFVRLMSLGGKKHDFLITGDSTMALVYIAPLAVGLMVGVVTAWRYWGWLIYATEFTPPVTHK